MHKAEFEVFPPQRGVWLSTELQGRYAVGGLAGGVIAMLGKIIDTIGGTAAFVLMLLIPVGWCYWLWTAIQLGSFDMFVVGMIPPLALIAAPLGLYGLLFGMPMWLLRAFG